MDRLTEYGTKALQSAVDELGPRLRSVAPPAHNGRYTWRSGGKRAPLRAQSGRDILRLPPVCSGATLLIQHIQKVTPNGVDTNRMLKPTPHEKQIPIKSCVDPCGQQRRAQHCSCAGN